MTSLLSVLSAAFAFAAALFGSNDQRHLVTLLAGVAAVIVACITPTTASVLAVLGGGVLIGGAAARRDSVLSVAVGVALIASSAVMGELAPAAASLVPLRVVAVLMAGTGCGWLLQSWEPRTRRWMMPVVGMAMLVLVGGLLAAHDITAGMAMMPVTTDVGTKALLVFRGSNAVEAYRWLVPVPYSVISITGILALVPIGALFSMRRGERGSKSLAGPAFSVLIGVLLLTSAFLVWGRAPEILHSTPGVGLLEPFRPASVASDWELVLRPLAESYRIDVFALVPVFFVGLFVTLCGLLIGLRNEDASSWTSSVSLWPASVAFTLSAMLFAAFQVDVAADTWAFAGGATVTLAAALCVAGLELQLGVRRRVRSRFAAFVAIAGIIAWLVYWSATI